MDVPTVANILHGYNLETLFCFIRNSLCRDPYIDSQPIKLMPFLLQCNSAQSVTLRKKCPYLEFFWSVLSCIRNEYGDLVFKLAYSVRMWKNTDQKNYKYGYFSRSVNLLQQNRGFHWRATCWKLNTFIPLNSPLCKTNLCGVKKGFFIFSLILPHLIPTLKDKA